MRVAERLIKVDGGFVSFHHLEIGFCGSQPVPLSEDGLADGSGVISVAVIRMDMDRVQADVFPVQNAEACGDDGSVRGRNGRADGLLGYRPVHGGYYRAVHDVRGALQSKKRFDPLQRYEAAGGDENIRLQSGDVFQRPGHYVGCVLDFVASVLQIAVKFGWNQRTDFEDTRRPPLPIDLFAVGNLFRNREKGGTDLFDTVGPVCIKIGKAENPSVVNLHLMGRPCVQRQVFNGFYPGIHSGLLLLESFCNSSAS